MSLLDELRESASRESDPEIRKQRLDRIAEIESGVQDVDRRLVAVRASLAEPRPSGHKRFFSSIEFVYGLGAFAALVGSFHYELSAAASIIVLCAVIFAMVGVHLLIIKSRVKKIDTSA